MANKGMQGWIKADNEALAFGLLGAAAGSAIGQAAGFTKGWQPTMAAVGGALAGQALRAFTDPELQAERK